MAFSHGRTQRRPHRLPPAQNRASGLFADFLWFARSLGVRSLVTFIVGGLVCLGLAWHLTAPIRRLRTATQRLTAGDLTARVGSEQIRGRDEIAALGRDFDLMAERIEELLTTQQHLLRDISHELRSPLARLSVALELARQRSGPEAGGALDRIGREAERLNDLIGQLLTLTRLENGGERIARGPVSLKPLIQAIAADADFEAQTHQRAVRAVVAEEAVIHGSEEMLRRGIENVVRNAVRYTAEGTEVEIAVSRRRGDSGDAAVIRVRDHGPGVPEEALSRMFLPFYRVADARDRQTGGTGIGLAITERADTPAQRNGRRRQRPGWRPGRGDDAAHNGSRRRVKATMPSAHLLAQPASRPGRSSDARQIFLALATSAFCRRLAATTFRFADTSGVPTRHHDS